MKDKKIKNQLPIYLKNTGFNSEPFNYTDNYSKKNFQVEHNSAITQINVPSEVPAKEFSIKKAPSANVKLKIAATVGVIASAILTGSGTAMFTAGVAFIAKLSFLIGLSAILPPVTIPLLIFGGTGAIFLGLELHGFFQKFFMKKKKNTDNATIDYNYQTNNFRYPDDEENSYILDTSSATSSQDFEI